MLSALMGVILSCGLQAAPPASDAKMDAFIGDLMGRMTLEEKIGQLNLLSVGFDVTGPVLSKDADTKIRHGPGGRSFQHSTHRRGAEIAIAGREPEPFGHSAAARIRCHSRSQNHFPDPAGAGLHLESWI